MIKAVVAFSLFYSSMVAEGMIGFFLSWFSAVLVFCQQPFSKPVGESSHECEKRSLVVSSTECCRGEETPRGKVLNDSL